MSEVGEVYQLMNEIRKERRQARLERANDTGWSKHTSHHWYIKSVVGKLDYWPSTGTLMLDGARVGKTNPHVVNMMLEEGVKMND